MILSKIDLDKLTPAQLQKVEALVDKLTDDSPLKRKPLIIEFRLSMPGVASWSGKWSGDGNNYVIYKQTTLKTLERLGLIRYDAVTEVSWTYPFSDGWRACVTARLLRRNEKKQKSDGFSGYNWMVDSIIASNCIKPRPSVKRS